LALIFPTKLSDGCKGSCWADAFRPVGAADERRVRPLHGRLCADHRADDAKDEPSMPPSIPRINLMHPIANSFFSLLLLLISSSDEEDNGSPGQFVYGVWKWKLR
jgi:hypothetical protein